ncbi:MAG: hypothetical protein ACUVXF_05965 [Desulfobaccales bacterium]
MIRPARLFFRLLTLAAVLALLSLACFLTLTPAAAETYTWNSSSGDWNTSTNWNPVGVPTASDNAIIDNDGIALISSAAAYALNLTVGVI